MVEAGAVRRGFVTIAEGQLHYRYVEGPANTPLILLHQASGSSRMMAPMMPILAAARPVVAFDLPGNGDSCAPVKPEPTIADYAEAIGRGLDGVGFGPVAVYGFHAGASVAIELALARPAQVRAIILDSLGLYDAAEAEHMAETYAPAFERHPHGLHLPAIWHYVRDTYLFWPWNETDAEHARGIGLPTTAEIHDKVVEVIKGMDHFAALYRAAFRHDKKARLPHIRIPALVAAGRTNTQRDNLKTISRLVRGSETAVTDGLYDPDSAARTAEIYAIWLAKALGEEVAPEAADG